MTPDMSGPISEPDPTKPIAGLALGLVGMVVGAIVWGLLAAFAGIQSWLVAIGTGLIIAWLVRRGAGEATVPLKVAIVGMTVGAVVFGEILGLAFSFLDRFGTFRIGSAFRIYFRSFEDHGPSLAFALGGGLVGAYYGLKRASTRRAQPVEPGQGA